MEFLNITDKWWTLPLLSDTFPDFLDYSDMYQSHFIQLTTSLQNWHIYSAYTSHMYVQSYDEDPYCPNEVNFTTISALSNENYVHHQYVVYWKLLIHSVSTTEHLWKSNSSFFWAYVISTLIYLPKHYLWQTCWDLFVGSVQHTSIVCLNDFINSFYVLIALGKLSDSCSVKHRRIPKL